MVQIPALVEYLDILGNKNSLSIGNAIFPIRSEKKGVKLVNQLDKILEALDVTLSPIKSSSNTDVQTITNGLYSVISKMKYSINDCVNNGEFNSAELGLTRLSNLNEFIGPLTVFFVKLEEDSNHLFEEIKTIQESSKGLIESIESLRKKFEL